MDVPSQKTNQRKGTPGNRPSGSFTHSGKIREQLNSLRFTPLKQNCSSIGFFLPSLTGFKGTPFGFVPSYSNGSFEFIGYMTAEISRKDVYYWKIFDYGTIFLINWSSIKSTDRATIHI